MAVATAGETCGGISTVHVGIGDTVHIGTVIFVRSDVNGTLSPLELTREGNVRKIHLGRYERIGGKQDGGHDVIT
jgi:hypothetical protein